MPLEFNLIPGAIQPFHIEFMEQFEPPLVTSKQRKDELLTTDYADFSLSCRAVSRGAGEGGRI